MCSPNTSIPLRLFLCSSDPNGVNLCILIVLTTYAEEWRFCWAEYQPRSRMLNPTIFCATFLFFLSFLFMVKFHQVPKWTSTTWKHTNIIMGNKSCQIHLYELFYHGIWKKMMVWKSFMVRKDIILFYSFPCLFSVLSFLQSQFKGDPSPTLPVPTKQTVMKKVSGVLYFLRVIGLSIPPSCPQTMEGGCLDLSEVHLDIRQGAMK